MHRCCPACQPGGGNQDQSSRRARQLRHGYVASCSTSAAMGWAGGRQCRCGRALLMEMHPAGRHLPEGKGDLYGPCAAPGTTQKALTRPSEVFPTEVAASQTLPCRQNFRGQGHILAAIFPATQWLAGGKTRAVSACPGASGQPRLQFQDHPHQPHRGEHRQHDQHREGCRLGGGACLIQPHDRDRANAELWRDQEDHR